MSSFMREETKIMKTKIGEIMKKVWE